MLQGPDSYDDEQPSSEQEAAGPSDFISRRNSAADVSQLMSLPQPDLVAHVVKVSEESDTNKSMVAPSYSYISFCL